MYSWREPTAATRYLVTIWTVGYFWILMGRPRKSGSASGMARTDYRTFYSCGSLWKRHTFRHSLCGKKQITFYYRGNKRKAGHMLQQFYPDHEADSAYGIDYKTLYRKGYRGIIFDIDNTLVPHGAPATPQAIEFFGRLRELGFQTLLLSNNKEPRVKSFADAVGASYIYKAGKPGRDGYLRAMEQMHTTKDTTLFVGDQLFTDVWGAKKCGIVTYLTRPIHPKEEIQIVLKRYLEKIVLFFYHRECRRKGK